MIDIHPNVHLFAVECCPAGTSKEEILSLARELQRAINGWCEEKRERDEEVRSLKGYDAQDIAEKF